MIEESHSVKIMGQDLRRMMKDQPVSRLEMFPDGGDQTNCMNALFDVEIKEIQRQVFILSTESFDLRDGCDWDNRGSLRGKSFFVHGLVWSTR